MKIIDAVSTIQEYLNESGADAETMKAMDFIRGWVTEVIGQLMKIREHWNHIQEGR